MDTLEISQNILQELENSLCSINPVETEKLINAIISANKVFVTGAGRSLLMVRALAMRLMQLGLDAHVVGETVTPAISSEDLLIVGSGSGETGTLKVIVKNAKEIRSRIGLITLNPNSSIGKLADVIVKIKATSTKVNQDLSEKSFQPGANLFEQSLMIICDSIVIKLIDKLEMHNPNKVLMGKHANLE